MKSTSVFLNPGPKVQPPFLRFLVVSLLITYKGMTLYDFYNDFPALVITVLQYIVYK